MQSYTFSVCRRCLQKLSHRFHTSARASRSSKRPPPSFIPVAPPPPTTHAFQSPRRLKTPQDNRPPQRYDASTLSKLPRPPEGRSYQGPPRLTTPPDNRPSNLYGTSTARELPLPLPPPPHPEEVRRMVLRHFAVWKSSRATIEKIVLLGVQRQEAHTLLNAYEPHILRQIRSETLTGEDPWSILHLVQSDTLDELAVVDRVLTMRFFIFVSKPGLKIRGVTAGSMHILERVSAAFDMRYPAEGFTIARRMRRRIILHVGPTNSGKTYNALRALATARNGVYAGPLRLLAHEVWERLNRGSIRPHGVDASEAHKYARPCNLITGEEQRIVSDSATHSSCTVEMFNMYGNYGVCVVDEIQMIADPERGHSWTAVVLGAAAEELHLCGEESAVPIITELAKETGDDLEVRHYQRLTPLGVAKKSLERRWDGIQKGDCIVTFARKSIFTLKRIVEKATGLRCAVAYGRLPPETRSEQAALFNDPGSGYDVMVASDAIGMGLNLKIKRIVFIELSKFDGQRQVPLSHSQVKQIGGRAGRFGEHGDSSSMGIVTCFNEYDMPLLAHAFETSPLPIRQARLPIHNTLLYQISQFLPPETGVQALHVLLLSAIRLSPHYTIPNLRQIFVALAIMDNEATKLTLREKMLFVFSPTNWRSNVELEIFTASLRQFTGGKTVELGKSLEDLGLMTTLQEVNEARLRHEEAKTVGPATGYAVQTSYTLMMLEELHRTIVTYIWMSYRIPISFSQLQLATKWRDDTGKCIEFVLEGIASVRAKGQIKSLRELRTENMDNKIEYAPRSTRKHDRLLRMTAKASA